MEIRVGLGHDIHRLASGRKLVLGGILIAHEQGLVGHSDADVLLHAVTDALLGAAGLGDIGGWFPDTDAKWAGTDSSDLLAAVLGEVNRRNWEVTNLDCTIFAEQPKLSPYKADIQRRLAELLKIGEELVNVKAKSGEAVGTIGREEAIAADAVVLLRRDERPAS